MNSSFNGKVNLRTALSNSSLTHNLGASYNITTSECQGSEGIIKAAAHCTSDVGEASIEDATGHGSSFLIAALKFKISRLHAHGQAVFFSFPLDFGADPVAG